MYRRERDGSYHPQEGLASSAAGTANRTWLGWRVVGLALAAVDLCWVVSATAQQAPLFPGEPEPGRNFPTPAPAPAPQFEFSIPAPRRGPVPRSVDEIEFDVSDIKVVGSTVFPAEAFKPLTAPLIGKKAKLSDMIAIADKIEAMYRDNGYVLTRAYVPPQTVANGVFQITVVEGFVKAAAVSGGDDDTRQRVEAYVKPVTEEKPATLDTMERGLLLANDLPGTVASGLLRPSPTEPGASDLLVNVDQTPWDATVYTDNRGAKSTGRTTVGAQIVDNDLYAVPGQFMIDASGTPDFDERKLFQARYTRPVGYDGAQLSVSGVVANGSPAAAGGSLVSDSYALGTRLSYPLIETREQRISVEGGLTDQEERVTVGSNSFCVFSDDRWHTVDGAVTVQQRGLGSRPQFQYRPHGRHDAGHSRPGRIQRLALHPGRRRLHRLHQIHCRAAA